MVREYMVKVYAFLIKEAGREIETIPEQYRIPVGEYLAAQEEKTNA